MVSAGRPGDKGVRLSFERRFDDAGAAAPTQLLRYLGRIYSQDKKDRFIGFRCAR